MSKCMICRKRGVFSRTNVLCRKCRRALTEKEAREFREKQSQPYTGSTLEAEHKRND